LLSFLGYHYKDLPEKAMPCKLSYDADDVTANNTLENTQMCNR
jgi:hypothetical protein